MRDTINHNNEVMAAVITKLAIRPIKFIINKDRQGNLTEIISVYEATH